MNNKKIGLFIYFTCILLCSAALNMASRESSPADGKAPPNV
jgi:hypothetical protein